LLLASCNFFKSKCESCNGTGQTTCLICSGTSEVNCGWCFGQGKKNCPSCNRMTSKYQNIYVGNLYKDGYQLINISGYSGYAQVIGGIINVNTQCQECNRTGKVKCSNVSCDDGKIKCINYSCENGNVNCIPCNGKDKK